MHRAVWLAALLLVPAAGAQTWEDDVGDVVSVVAAGFTGGGDPQRITGPPLVDRGDVFWLRVHVEDAVIVSLHTDSEVVADCGNGTGDRIWVIYTFAGQWGSVRAVDYCDSSSGTSDLISRWKPPQGDAHDLPVDAAVGPGGVTYTWRMPLEAFWAASDALELTDWRAGRELGHCVGWGPVLFTWSRFCQEDTAWWPESTVTLPARLEAERIASDEPTAAEPTAAEPTATHTERAPPTLFELLLQARQPPADQHEPGTFVPVVLAVMAAALLLRPRWSWAAAALFTRISQDRLTDHPRRARIIELVAARPGISFSELRRALGTGSGAALHHLRMLERADRIRSLHLQGRTSYFIRGVPADPLDALHGTRRRIREILGRRPGLTQHQLAARIGLTRETVGHHVRALVAEGLLHASRQRAIRYYLR